MKENGASSKIVKQETDKTSFENQIFQTAISQFSLKKINQKSPIHWIGLLFVLFFCFLVEDILPSFMATPDTSVDDTI